MRIGKITSSAEYRMDKRLQNLLIFWISIVFQIKKILKICQFFKLWNSENSLIFQFRKFLNFLIKKNSKTSIL